jgi:hypothetical protein
MKLQENKNKGRNLHYIDWDSDVLGHDLKANVTKAKVAKWVCIKLKAFCTAKEKIWSVGQATECEKVFASGKRLTFKIYKELQQLNCEKKSPIKNDQKILNRHF